MSYRRWLAFPLLILLASGNASAQLFEVVSDPIGDPTETGCGPECINGPSPTADIATISVGQNETHLIFQVRHSNATHVDFPSSTGTVHRSFLSFTVADTNWGMIAVDSTSGFDAKFYSRFELYQDFTYRGGAIGDFLTMQGTDRSTFLLPDPGSTASQFRVSIAKEALVPADGLARMTTVDGIHLELFAHQGNPGRYSDRAPDEGAVAAPLAFVAGDPAQKTQEEGWAVETLARGEVHAVAAATADNRLDLFWVTSTDSHVGSAGLFHAARVESKWSLPERVAGYNLPDHANANVVTLHNTILFATYLDGRPTVIGFPSTPEGVRPTVWQQTGDIWAMAEDLPVSQATDPRVRLPDVATGPDGLYLILWNEQGAHLVTGRPGAWSVRQTFAQATAARVAVGQDGHAHVVWHAATTPTNNLLDAVYASDEDGWMSHPTGVVLDAYAERSDTTASSVFDLVTVRSEPVLVWTSLDFPSQVTRLLSTTLTQDPVSSATLISKRGGDHQYVEDYVRAEATPSGVVILHGKSFADRVSVLRQDGFAANVATADRAGATVIVTPDGLAMAWGGSQAAVAERSLADLQFASAATIPPPYPDGPPTTGTPTTNPAASAGGPQMSARGTDAAPSTTNGAPMAWPLVILSLGCSLAFWRRRMRQ